MYLGLTLVSPFRLCLHLVWIIALVIGLPKFSSPLDNVHRSKTHTCPRITLCLAHAILVSLCMTLSVFMTTSLIKSFANGYTHLTSRLPHYNITFTKHECHHVQNNNMSVCDIKSTASQIMKCVICWVQCMLCGNV